MHCAVTIWPVDRFVGRMMAPRYTTRCAAVCEPRHHPTNTGTVAVQTGWRNPKAVFE